MTSREDLSEVNAALRELVRLQLAGELEASAAWQARRDMLSSVEAAWHDLRQDLTPEAMASIQPVTVPVRLSWRERWQRRRPISVKISWPSVKRMRVPKIPAMNVRHLLAPQRLAALARLPWWSLFLGLALVTFYYVSTL